MQVESAAVVVVAVRAVGLHLKGTVVYADAVEELLDAVGDLLEHRGLGYDDVARQRRLRRRDGPDVHVVHVEHAVEAFNLVADIVHVEAFRHGVGAHAQALGEQLPGADEDYDGDDEAYDGVDKGPAGEVDDHAGGLQPPACQRYYRYQT